jgi:hypothetical protein
MIDFLPRNVASISPSIRKKFPRNHADAEAVRPWRELHIDYAKASGGLFARHGDGVSIAGQTDVREVVGLRERQIALGFVWWNL